MIGGDLSTFGETSITDRNQRTQLTAGTYPLRKTSYQWLRGILASINADTLEHFSFT